MMVLRRARFRRTAWKNGGGITHEVIRVPAEGEFNWRLSVAEIERSGPFSDFTGFSRTMVLLAGGGLTLRDAGGDSHLKSPGDLIQFDGALRVHCDLSGGPCTDLNLMVANAAGAVTACVDDLDAAISMRAAIAQTRIVFAVQGTCAIAAENGARAVLETWDAAVLSAAEGRIRSTPDVQGAAGRAFIASF